MSSAHVPSMHSPRVLIPFMLTGTIWGSTWFVITGQIADVPAAWGVFYRFMLATPALFALAFMMGNRLRLNRPEHLLALGVGIAQFSGNFLFVYHAEQHITSGIVAVMFALLMVPNAIFAKAFIGEKVASGFIGGSLVAIAGVALLLVHDRVALQQFHNAHQHDQQIVGGAGAGVERRLFGLGHRGAATAGRQPARLPRLRLRRGGRA